MEFELILQNLKKGIYHPIYLLQGEEPYFIDVISDYIEDNAITDAEKGFNQSIFYGKDSNVLSITESARRFPMMAAKQVVIVKEAQSLSKIEDLVSYTEKPLESTILVLAYKYKTLDKRTKLAKSISKNGVVFTSAKLYENKIPGWIENFLRGHGYQITPQAAQILTAYLGNDLGKIANELKKLIIAVPESARIDAGHIEKNIGLRKDFNVFELQNALGEKDVFKANQIILYFAANPNLNSIQKTINSLFYYFLKLFSYHFLTDKSDKNVAAELRINPFFVRSYVAAAKRYSPTKLYEIFGLLREYDLKSKGFNVSPLADSGMLQKELIYKILH